MGAYSRSRRVFSRRQAGRQAGEQAAYKEDQRRPRGAETNMGACSRIRAAC